MHAVGVVATAGTAAGGVMEVNVARTPGVTLTRDVTTGGAGEPVLADSGDRRPDRHRDSSSASGSTETSSTWSFVMAAIRSGPTG